MSLSPAPETVRIEGRIYRPVREGSASILAPYRDFAPGAKKAKNNDEGDQAVFYNPIQQFNRDLSVLAILIYGEGAVIEKTERYRKKHQTKRNRKKSQQKATTSTQIGDAADTVISENSVNPQKRKLDDTEDEHQAEEEAKRLKTDEFEPDGDELAIMQLAEPEQATATTEINIEPHSEAVKDSNGISVLLKSVNGVKTKTSRRQGTAFTILDALSATGLRALRYAKEIPFATKVIANDLSQEAIKSIELNVDHNDLKGIVFSNVGDARSYMYSKLGDEHSQPSEGYVHRFDVIDLDPYGTAAPFFDAAVQSLQDGGLLCITCTDAGVFASTGYLEKTYDLYGGLPLKGAHSHEGGLRLILHAIATSAAKYGIAIEPLLSLSIDFYARLFVRVHKQQKDAKLLAGTTMLVYSCDFGCGSWVTQPMARNQPKQDKNGDTFFKYSLAQGPLTNQQCEHCDSKMHLGGPMWSGPLHNPYFVQRILDRLPTLDKNTYGTLDRLQGMLTVALEEDLTLSTTNTSAGATSTPTSASESKLIPRLPPQTIDTTPFFFIPNYIAKVLHCTTPSEDALRGAIRHLGYRVTRSHCKAGSFRTDAPWNVIWEIFREWIRNVKPIKEGAVKVGSPGWNILAKMRGSKGRVIGDLSQEIREKMAKVVDLEELRTVLESAMWRLEHPSVSKDANASPPSNENEAAGVPDAASVRTREIVFDEQLGKEKPRGKLVRYQINPRANWGPMNRAGGNSA